MTAKRLSDRNFGFAFAGLFILIAGLGWFAFDSLLVWALAASAAFFVVALARPALLLPLNRLWDSFARRLGALTNFLVLGSFFLVCVLPIGLLLKLLGKDPMRRRLEPGSESYWLPVRRQVREDTLRDMF